MGRFAIRVTISDQTLITQHTAGHRSVATASMSFKPVLSGESTEPVPGVYDLTLGGTLEPQDIYTVVVDGSAFSYEVRPGDSVEQVFTRLAYDVNEATRVGTLENLEASVQDGALQFTALDGVDRQISVGTSNSGDPVDDFFRP